MKARKSLTTFPTVYQRICGFDFETTGIHLQHGDMPFMLSMTYDDGEQEIWIADVDPMTRKPIWDPDDLAEIEDRFQHEDWLYVGSNVKFDVRCAALIIDLDPVELLCRCHDTIVEHHSVHNAESHKLKDAGVKHAGIPDDDEKALKQATMQARVIAKRLGWKIANKENCPQQRRAPSSAQGGWAVMDMWMPRAVAKHMWHTSIARQYLEDIGRRTNVSVAWVYRHSSPEEKQRIHRMAGWEWRPENPDWEGQHPWWDLCATYCNRDTFRSVILHKAFTKALEEDELIEPYLDNRTALPISYLTESRGITVNITKAKELILKFQKDRKNAELALVAAIKSRGFNCSSPDQVRNILYKYFGLPVTRYTKPKKPTSKPNPTTDSDFIAEVIKTSREMIIEEGDNSDDFAPPLWQEGVESFKDFEYRLNNWHNLLVEKEKPSSRQLFAFSSCLMMFKKANTSIKYLEGYIHSAKPHPQNIQFESDARKELDEYLADFPPNCTLPTSAIDKRDKLQDALAHRTCFGILHPSLNPIGTKTTRYSSSNPNGQNISKGGKGKKGLEFLFKTNHSLRSVFGPVPGREWWAFDYHQIQLVIFAMLCGDEKMVAAVYRGEDFHTFMAKQIFGYDDITWEACGEDRQKYCRDIAKTVNFAFVFGAQEDKLNRTAGMPGLYDILCNVFPAAVDFLQRTEWDVRRDGYVVTPGGYRLFVPEETPFAGVNYMVQGAEGEIVKRAQYGIQAYFNRAILNPMDMYMTLYVHDELVFDAKQGYGQQQSGRILGIMNDAALSYGIPCQAEAKLITEDWSKGKKLVAI